MATKEEEREKFISLLHQLFQLDQTDLDFGFYRITHAKAGQPTNFLEVASPFEPIGDVPPAVKEEPYYQQLTKSAMAA